MTSPLILLNNRTIRSVREVMFKLVECTKDAYKCHPSNYSPFQALDLAVGIACCWRRPIERGGKISCVTGSSGISAFFF